MYIIIINYNVVVLRNVIRGQLQFATVERDIIIVYIILWYPRVSVCALFAACRSAISLYCD